MLKRLILQIIARMSLIVYPYRLSRFMVTIRNAIVSKRFCYMSHNDDADVYMEYPVCVYGHKYIRCGDFSSRAGLRLECWDTYIGQKYTPSLIIGNNVCFNFRCHVGVINKVVIGNNVLIGSNVLITDHAHGCTDESDIDVEPSKRSLYSKGPVIIEENVWIGENVSILPNVRIGRNSVIGANSVVTKDLPPYSIAVGNPVKVIKIIRNE